MAFTLTVNGKSQTVDAPADMPLLWVIRDILNLKGTTFGWAWELEVGSRKLIHVQTKLAGR